LRVVRSWGRPVSCLVMHFPNKLAVFTAFFLALSVCIEGRIQAQNSSSSSQSQPPQSTQPTPAPAAQSPDSQVPSLGTYVASDPLAKVRYDNRWDVSLGAAYDHMKAGPNLLQGANLGGLDADGSYWLTRKWGIEGSVRPYIGTSGTAPNKYNLKGPIVKETFFVAGAEWLGPHNKHGAIIAHAMIGGVYGNFESDLLGYPPSTFAFYNNQVALAAIIGGHFDLNRSEHWVFRVTPDATIKRYGINYAPYTTSTDVNFAISVGLQYKFMKPKRSTKPGNWVSGW
jgi:hypothetical protein